MKPLTKRQVEVLEAVHYGEVVAEYEQRKSAQGFLGTWFVARLEGVNVISIIAKLKNRSMVKRRTVRNFSSSPPLEYYVLTPAGLQELEKHPAPWKD